MLYQKLEKEALIKKRGDIVQFMEYNSEYLLLKFAGRNPKNPSDFNNLTESGGGSCSMASRYAQIENTLKQFPTVSSVKLSINGRTGDIFQP